MTTSWNQRGPRSSRILVSLAPRSSGLGWLAMAVGLALFVATTSLFAQATPPFTLDSSFNPSANGAVSSLAVQVDGKILVGGGFTTLGGQPRSRVARLNAGGTLDGSFNPGANGAVSSLVVQADGKILVAGGFTTLGGKSRNRVARLVTVDPTITAQPLSASRPWGKSVTFSVTAVGAPPLKYQWWKEGMALAQETGATLTLTSLQRDDAGLYTVVVSNLYGA